jgi:hypothetical protein
MHPACHSYRIEWYRIVKLENILRDGGVLNNLTSSHEYMSYCPLPAVARWYAILNLLITCSADPHL